MDAIDENQSADSELNESNLSNDRDENNERHASVVNDSGYEQVVDEKSDSEEVIDKDKDDDDDHSYYEEATKSESFSNPYSYETDDLNLFPELSSRTSVETKVELNPIFPENNDNLSFKAFHLTTRNNVGLSRYTDPIFFSSNALSTTIESQKKEILGELFVNIENEQQIVEGKTDLSAENKRFKRSLKKNEEFMSKLRTAYFIAKSNEYSPFHEKKVGTEQILTLVSEYVLNNSVGPRQLSTSDSSNSPQTKKRTNTRSETHQHLNDQGISLIDIRYKPLGKIFYPKHLSIHGLNLEHIIFGSNKKKKPNQIVDWSTRVNEVSKELKKGSINIEKHQLKAYSQLNRLMVDFVETAQGYAKIIINELWLPNSQKTIQPINFYNIHYGTSDHVTMYSIQNILFRLPHPPGRFPWSNRWDKWECALKYASNELKGYTRISTYTEQSLCVPLMTVFDYKGFRIIATSTCPVDKRLMATGKQIVPIEVRDSLTKVQTALNLCSHHVNDGHEVTISGKLEIHKGFDNNFYLFDFSSVFPLEATEHFVPKSDDYENYKYLRPEFVRNYYLVINGSTYVPHPLCSDTHTSLMAKSSLMTETKMFENEIHQATNFLHHEHIDAFSQFLINFSEEIREKQTISVLFHERGINIRHLGLVFRAVKSIVMKTNQNLSISGSSPLKNESKSPQNFASANTNALARKNTNKSEPEVDKNSPYYENALYWCSRLLFSMVVRSLKVVFKEEMRNQMMNCSNLVSESSFRATTVQFFNKLFGKQKSTDSLWKKVSNVLRKKYAPFDIEKEIGFISDKTNNTIAQEVYAAAHIISNKDGRCYLFERLCSAIEVEWDPQTFTDAKSLPSFFEAQPLLGFPTPFMLTDLSMIHIKSKDMIALTQSIGYMFFVLSSLMKTADAQKRLLRMATISCQKSQIRNPEDIFSLRTLGDCFTLLHQFQEAEKSYERAKKIDPFNPITLFKIALCFDLQERLDNAEDYYLQAIRRSQNNATSPVFAEQAALICCCYADFLAYDRRLVDDAQKFYELALDIYTNSAITHNNYAIFLAVIRRQYTEAEEHFLTCLSLNEKQRELHSSTYMNNYITFLCLSNVKPFRFFGITNERETRKLVLST